MLEAAAHYSKALPMMMTSAGTISPAKVLIIGVGVAGLQAIATAKRMGAVVSAFDVRPEAAEQAESLGAKFLKPDTDEQVETEGGYAKETSAAYKKAQDTMLKEAIKKQDIVITTALILGRPAPKIVSKKMVESMSEGSVIVDIAASMGGNVEVTVAEKAVEHKGVKIIGPSNILNEVAGSASQMYAKNLFNFVDLITDAGALKIDEEDEIVKACMIMKEGKLR